MWSLGRKLWLAGVVLTWPVGVALEGYYRTQDFS